ncbi:MAG: phosphoribosylformylglycinamidine cyclo-ligase [Sphaerobacteraceae bacterium]|nr:MAG: phosphoribosylformylglycinamidine cyclo-ligase [Sphaerobacteraceae bacterium]
MSDQSSSGFTYQKAGVDNTSGARAKARIGEMVRGTYTPDVIGDFGHFGGMFRSPGNPSSILVSSADSVGTKVLLAVLAGEHRGIGVDLVNHSVNDILCCGARPLFFLDYFATSGLDEAVLADIMEGMTSACVDAGCALVGGETAQLPGIYQESTYDLAGFMVGTVEEANMIDGSSIAEGQLIVGFASNGLHTNGYSLARAVLGLSDEDVDSSRSRLADIPETLGESLGDALLRPHPSYLHQIVPYLDTGMVHGLAHITGGGIAGNLERIIPDDCTAVIQIGSWPELPLFKLIQQRGDVASTEMYDVFNMGVGFILVADADLARQIADDDRQAHIIGEIRSATSPDERVALHGMSAS